MIFASFNSLVFWLTQTMTIILSVFIIIALERLNIFYNDTITNNLRLQKYEQDQAKRKLTKKIEKMSQISRNVVKFKKILLDENFKVDNYSDKRVKVWVDTFKNNNEWEENELRKKKMEIGNGNGTGTFGANNTTRNFEGNQLKIEYNNVINHKTDVQETI